MKYKYKAKDYKKKVQRYFSELNDIEDEFNMKVIKLEERMAKELKIPTIMFFYCDNEIVGIGSADRTMELIQRWESER